MPELFLIVALYALWEWVPRKRDVLGWFWCVVLIGAAIGFCYTVVITGSLPSPATG